MYSRTAILAAGFAAALMPGAEAARACTASSLGFLCQTTVNLDPLVRIHYTLAQNKSAVDLAIEAANNGHAALGVGTSPVGAQIVLGFVDDANNNEPVLVATIPTADNQDGVIAGIVENPTFAVNLSVVQVQVQDNVTTTTSFTYLIPEGGQIPDLTAASFVWGELNEDVARVPHRTSGVVVLNLEEALDIPVDRQLVNTTFLRNCILSTLEGFTCQTTVQETPLVTIHYALATDATTVDLAVQAATEGYAAIGAGTAMVGAEIVLGLVDAAGAETLVATIPEGRNVEGVTAGAFPTVDDAPYVVPGSASVVEADGITTTVFTYDLTADVSITDTSAASLVWAHRPDDQLAAHSNTDRGGVTLNLDESRRLNCVESNLPGFACQVNVSADPSVAVHYVLSADQSTVNLAVEATTEGYAAVGVGNQMVGAQILLGFSVLLDAAAAAAAAADAAAAGIPPSLTNDTLVATIPQARSLDGVLAGVVNVTEAEYIQDASASVREANGVTVTSFTYPIAEGGNIQDLTAASFVWAQLAEDTIARHGGTDSDRGVTTVNLQDSLLIAAGNVEEDNDERDDWVRNGLLVGGGAALVGAGMVASVLAGPAAGTGAGAAGAVPVDTMV